MNTGSTSFIKTGCCGFRYAMATYFERYSLVEIQHTFYQPPTLDTLKRWRSEAPADFEFTLKAWQLITHEAKSPTYKRLKRKLTPEELSECGAFRPTPIVFEAWETTRACAEALNARCVLLQCPASFRPTEENVENMRSLLPAIDRGNLQLLWEPRGGWPEDLVLEICEELDLVHVVDPFIAQSVTPHFRYFRLHGRTGYRYVYEDFELEELREMALHDGPSYVLFNNIAMRDDAARFGRMRYER